MFFQNSYSFLHHPLPEVPPGRLCNPTYWDDGIWGWLVDREPLKAWHGLQRVRTIPGVWPWAVRTLGFLREQTEFQSTWVRVAAWCWTRHRIRFPVAAMLGLTRPREVGTFVLFLDVGIPTSFLREGIHSKKQTSSFVLDILIWVFRKWSIQFSICNLT